ncbi:MAG TPA: hypothetical protein VKT82_12980 [Ktedonobacterales bacterium]|nr:hypothetical protein [Ktedonobacterales bacterium]
MIIGKVVKSDSHIAYACQVYSAGEVEVQPGPNDCAFGQFVRAAVRTGGTAPHAAGTDGHVTGGQRSAHQTGEIWAIGIIYDTILLNPAFGTLGPRLSNAEQMEIFSPDYLSERAMLVYFSVLGLMERATPTSAHWRVTHGVPPVALELGCEVETIDAGQIRAFHLFADDGEPGGAEPYLHMGYLPHLIAQRNSLLPQVALRIVEQLEQLFPQNRALLNIVKSNFAWKLKVETTG